MRADRLLCILLLLQTKGKVTAQMLAERLEVSERTIYRDLEALSMAGIPIYAERGPGGGWYLTDTYQTKLTQLTGEEVTSLVMASTASPMKDLGLGKVLDAAWLKILAALPALSRENAEFARQRIHIDTSSWFQTAEPVPYLQTVQDAVWQNRRLQIHYHSTSRDRDRYSDMLIEPLGLVAKAGIWYLVCQVHKELRTLRVTRIQSLVETEDYFQRPEDFNLITYWNKWCNEFHQTLRQYEVIIRFPRHAIPILARIFGGNFQSRAEQEGQTDEQGNLLLTLYFESLEVAASLLFSPGPLIEVVEPEELRQQMAQAATAISRLYNRQSESPATN